MTIAVHALVAGAKLYQVVVRPLTACQCRFYPRCSDYGIEAVRTHGAARGSLLAARRVLRCNPWTAGGYDPVQPASPSLVQPGNAKSRR